MTRPASTSTIRSALTTTVSACAAAAAQVSKTPPARTRRSRAKESSFIIIRSLCFDGAEKLSQHGCGCLDGRRHLVEARGIHAPYVRECDDVLQDVLYVAAGFGVRNILQPDVGIHRLARQ